MIHIIAQIAILYVFYLLGVFIQTSLGLTIPGSIIGMLLLFLALVTKLISVKFIEKGAAFMTKHMPLVFLPVTVGIMQFFDVFKGKGMLVVLVTLISTLMVMASTGFIAEKLVMKNKTSREQSVHEESDRKEVDIQ